MPGDSASFCLRLFKKLKLRAPAYHVSCVITVLFVNVTLHIKILYSIKKKLKVVSLSSATVYGRMEGKLN
jgi:hypothetical protein